MLRNLLLVVLLVSCGTRNSKSASTAAAALPNTSATETPGPNETVSAERSVILLIGDGMGPALLQWSRLNGGRRAVDRMDDSAVVLTSSDSDVVTDSAAAATAMATGRKTKNRSLGVDASGNSVQSVAELAKKQGKQVGLVTTSFLWDATPGAFFAHTTDRDNHDLITTQALAARFDLLLGGGAAALDPAHRQDGKDMRRAFADAGYHVVDSATAPGLPLLGVLAPEALFSESPPQYAPPVSLPAMARVAIHALSGAPKGFFLLIEDEGIDEMAHGNALQPLGLALTAFDQTVGIALEYRRAHPDTVVVVLSDHDTGGLDLTAPSDCANRMPATGGGKSYCVGFSSTAHTALPVTLFVSGLDVKGAVIENTRVYDVLREGLGLE